METKDLKDIRWIEEHEHVSEEGNKYYSNKFVITYYNGVKEAVVIYEPKDKAYKLLEELDFREQILDSLDRFAEDEVREDITDIYTWNSLYDKVANNKELDEDDIDDVTLCVHICTIFDKFDYRDYMEYRRSIDHE